MLDWSFNTKQQKQQQTNNMTDFQQIYKSVLKSAIQKSFRKNFPLILEDAIQYLEEHDWQVKERRKRSKKPPPVKNIEDLEKRTDKKLSKTAEKMKTTPYLNLNTNRVHSDSKQIKERHPDLQFGHVTQGQIRVWVCGTPGHLETALTELSENDEKIPAIFEPFSKMESIPEEDEVENEEVEKDEVKNEEVENEREDKLVNQSFSDLSDNDMDDIYKMLDQPEEELPPPPVVGSSSPQRSDNPPQIPSSVPILLEGVASISKQVGLTKKIKRRKRKKGKKLLKNGENGESEIVL